MIIHKKTLSVIIITRNEEKFISDCLKSVVWADEIILLDLESSDNTKKIAEKFQKVKFYQSKKKYWLGYGIQRQRAQKYASGDMILMLDADERVTNNLKKSINLILKKNHDQFKNYVYSISRRNFFLNKYMKYSGWYPDRVIRLYPSHLYYNDSQIHESLNVKKEKIIFLKGDLIHLACLDFFSFLKKQIIYAKIWAKQESKKKHCSIFSIFFHSFAAFFKVLFIKYGFLDGKNGWLLALTNLHYTFHKYLILWFIKNKKNL